MSIYRIKLIVSLILICMGFIPYFILLLHVGSDTHWANLWWMAEMGTEFVFDNPYTIQSGVCIVSGAMILARTKSDQPPSKLEPKE
ncbi:hypothetical protein WBG78_15715 [Chryseolinea sp. T2]|uniref:hypothetical protein n=1 Tax=Chryseolinea sp. T2 TaxID=3129255 RepID=UPI003078A1B1